MRFTPPTITYGSRLFNGHPDSVSIGSSIYMLEATAGEYAQYVAAYGNGHSNTTRDYVVTGPTFTRPTNGGGRWSMDTIRICAAQAQREVPEGTPHKWTKVDVTK